MSETKSPDNFDSDGESEQTIPLLNLSFRHKVVEWCLRNAQSNLNLNLLEECVRWDLIAASIASLDCSPLSYPALEEHLLEVATRLPVPKCRERAPATEKNGKWLHVLNEALPVGGHTAMAARWMSLDPDQNKHSVILLGQREAVPDFLNEAAKRTGGCVKQLDPDATFVDRALALRQYAWDEADVIVLHIDVSDVIAVAALSVTGGPPVLLVNHAAHIFWVGCSLADLVLNCRGSELEHAWTVRHRGINPERSITLPIPLPPPAGTSIRRYSEEAAKAAREELLLPPDAVVILTVGRTYKYSPLPGLDFLDTVTRILQKRDDVYLLAVGVEEDERWKGARDSTAGRLRAVGCQSGLRLYHDVADIYIEGFPFGSTTALLEAGLQGIPCVLAPASSPPPFATDGLAVDVLDRPDDIPSYIDRIMRLLEDRNERVQIGKVLAASIYNHHCETGWSRYLETVKRQIPHSHKVHPLFDSPPVSGNLAAYWSQFKGLDPADPILSALQYSLHLGLNPFFDKKLIRALFAASSFRKGHLLIDILAGITGPISALFPRVPRSARYTDLFYTFRPKGRIIRFLSRLRLINLQTEVQ